MDSSHPSLYTASGGRVSSAVDRSGNNTMTEGTAAQQFYTGDATINGINAFRSDNTAEMGLSFGTLIDMYDKEIHYVVQPDLSEDMSILGGESNYQVATLLDAPDYKMRNWRNGTAWTPVDVKSSWTLTSGVPIVGASICDITSKSFMLNGEIETGLGVQNSTDLRAGQI